MRCRGFAAALLAGLLIPTAAGAHAILIASRPAVGGSVAAGRIDFELRYNSRIDASRSRLTLTRPDKSQTVLVNTPGQQVDTLAATAQLSPGAYSLRWQVLAIDGHITRGDVPFTVTPPATATPPITATP